MAVKLFINFGEWDFVVGAHDRFACVWIFVMDGLWNSIRM